MFEQFELGSSPNGEDCVQVNSKVDYMPAMNEEVKRYKAMLETRFPIPEFLAGQVRFAITSNSHDFGTYKEVCIKYFESDEQALEFALHVEGNCPELWNDTAVLTFTPVEQTVE